MEEITDFNDEAKKVDSLEVLQLNGKKVETTISEKTNEDVRLYGT